LGLFGLSQNATGFSCADIAWMFGRGLGSNSCKKMNDVGIQTELLGGKTAQKSVISGNKSLALGDKKYYRVLYEV